MVGITGFLNTCTDNVRKKQDSNINEQLNLMKNYIQETQGRFTFFGFRKQARNREDLGKFLLSEIEIVRGNLKDNPDNFKSINDFLIAYLLRTKNITMREGGNASKIRAKIISDIANLSSFIADKKTFEHAEEEAVKSAKNNFSEIIKINANGNGNEGDKILKSLISYYTDNKENKDYKIKKTCEGIKSLFRERSEKSASPEKRMKELKAIVKEKLKNNDDVMFFKKIYMDLNTKIIKNGIKDRISFDCVSMIDALSNPKDSVDNSIDKLPINSLKDTSEKGSLSTDIGNPIDNSSDNNLKGISAMKSEPEIISFILNNKFKSLNSYISNKSFRKAYQEFKGKMSDCFKNYERVNTAIRVVTKNWDAKVLAENPVPVNKYGAKLNRYIEYNKKIVSELKDKTGVNDKEVESALRFIQQTP